MYDKIFDIEKVNDTTIVCSNHNKEEFMFSIDEDEFELLIILKPSDRVIGSFEFRDLSLDDDISMSGFKICSMDIDEGFRRIGLGTIAIKFFKEFQNCKIYAGIDNGYVGDGSNLTGDGVPFVDKLLEDNIIDGQF